MNPKCVLCGAPARERVQMEHGAFVHLCGMHHRLTVPQLDEKKELHFVSTEPTSLRCCNCGSPARRMILGPKWVIDICSDCWAKKAIPKEWIPAPMAKAVKPSSASVRRSAKSKPCLFSMRLAAQRVRFKGSTNDPCVYCGGIADTIDHIVPKSVGGPNHWTNYAPACRACNSLKSSEPLLRFVLSRRGTACSNSRFSQRS